jgi:type I restriction enzyme S subunit
VNELPSRWTWAELRQVCTSITDGDHQAPPQVPSGIPFLVIGNIRTGTLDFTNCRHVPPEYFESLDPARRPQKGDVLYSLVGSYGIPVLIRDDRPFCVQRHIGILRPSPQINRAFLALVMSSQAVFDQATQYATGTAQLTVPLSGLRRIRIPLPPRQEQDRIVAAIEEQFTRADAGFSALDQARQNLKRMRGSVLQAATTGGLPSGISDQRSAADFLAEILETRRNASRRPESRYAEPTRPVDSKISIPRHWTFASLDMLAESAGAITDGPFGSNLKTSHYTSFGPRVIRLQNVGDGEFIDIEAHISDTHYQSLIKHSVGPGDLVCVLLGEVLPRAVIIPSDIGPAIVKADCPRIRVSPLVNRRYVWAALNSPGVRQEVSRRIHGVGRPRLTLRELREVAIPLPPRQEQDAIVDTMDRQLEIIDQVSSEIDRWHYKVERLRTAILNFAFSGKLVAQDLHDEPAPALLERIVAEQASSNDHKRARARKPRVSREKIPV